MKRITRSNAITACVLFLLVCVLGLGLMDRSHQWGDDYAAYMLEGKAIAEGTLDEQIRINRKIHPSILSFGESEIPESVTYVWGYPLVLAAVYRSVGYDLEETSIHIAYKLPNLIAYAWFVSVVFLFYRRRLAFVPSLFLSLLFALNEQILPYVNMVLSDVFCLALSMTALYLIELFLECDQEKKRTGIGILLGVILWYNYEVRLNGVTVIGVVAFAHVLYLLRVRPEKRMWIQQCSPYLTLLILLGISICVMPQATSNTHHIASGPNKWILHNLNYYNGVVMKWLIRMVPLGFPMRDYVPYAVYACTAVGVLYAGIRRNLHLTVLLMGTFAVLLLLPYTQSLRYLFNVLPLILLFTTHGIQLLWEKAKGRLGRRIHVLTRCAGYALMLVFIVSMSGEVVQKIESHVKAGGMEYRYGAYSEDAVELYQFVRANTAEEDVIAFLKPRAMMLNTGRLCYVPGVNENRFTEMDYYISFGEKDDLAEDMGQEMWSGMTEIYRNRSYVMYKPAENLVVLDEDE